MQEYGFTVRDAVEWFIIAKCDSSKNYKYQKLVLEDEIYQLKLDLICKEMELDELNKRIENMGK